MRSAQPGPALLAATALLVAAMVLPATATAADELHNVTYIAKIDGVHSGAAITYRINDTETNTATPMMLAGRVFEANAVLANPKKAGMQISIQWPYSANLHCEIDVDGAIVAQADEEIPLQVAPVSDDPLYGVMQCGAPFDDLAT